MILDKATNAQIEAAQILSGATMAGFLAASMFRNRARRVQLMVAALYLVGVVMFLVFALL